jgi:peptidoglycan/LPS O-acetylase OafA/YrhL
MTSLAVAPAPATESAPPVVAPPPGHPRFPLLDSLRGVAALGVLLGHVAAVTGITTGHWWSPFVSNGDQGVTLFFILSGFLLYRPMVSVQLNGAPATSWRDYARRRFLRIVPAYWLALTVLAIWPGLPGVFTGNWWWYYGFLQVYDHDVSIGGLYIAWTLCVEVSFYAVLPFYAGAIGRATRTLTPTTRVRVELLVLGALGIGSLALRFAAPRSLLTLPVFFSWFAVGMALAVLSAALQRRTIAGPQRLARFVARRPGACWAGALGLYLVLCLGIGIPSAAGYTPFQDVVLHRVVGGAMALCLVLPAVFGATAGGWPRRVMAWGWLVWLGLVSYGIYLWHVKLLSVVLEHVNIDGDRGVRAFVLLAALTVLATATVAAASYYVLERPILRLKFRGDRVGADPV